MPHDTQLLNMIPRDLRTVIHKGYLLLVDGLSSLWVELQRHDRDRYLSAKREQKDGFEKRLRKRWGNGLDCLEQFIHINIELGEEAVQDRGGAFESDVDYTFEALARLHARACQISNEIYTLLESGYADGAHARWRALHEVAIVALFIKQEDEETAKRFLDYRHLEDYYEAQNYQAHCEELGYKPFSEEQLQVLEDNRDKLVNRYGTPFDDNGYGYGWAAHTFENKSATLSRLENEVDLDHLNPFYKMASNSVHAGSKGTKHRLGLLDQDAQPLLAGPTNYGLADPAQSTATSLAQVSTALLLYEPSGKELVTTMGLQQLVSEISTAFTEIQFQIEREEMGERLVDSLNNNT